MANRTDIASVYRIARDGLSIIDLLAMIVGVLRKQCKGGPCRGQENCKVGRNVILSAAKNLRVIAEVLACQRDSSLRSE